MEEPFSQFPLHLDIADFCNAEAARPFIDLVILHRVNSNGKQKQKQDEDKTQKPKKRKRSNSESDTAEQNFDTNGVDIELDLELKKSLQGISHECLPSAIESTKIFTLFYVAVRESNRNILSSGVKKQFEEFLFASCLSLLNDIILNHSPSQRQQNIHAFEKIFYLVIYYIKSEEEKFYNAYCHQSFDCQQLDEWINTKTRFLNSILREVLVTILQNYRLFNNDTLKGFFHLYQVAVFSFLCHKWNFKDPEKRKLHVSEVSTFLTEALTTFLLSTQALLPTYCREITQSLITLLSQQPFLCDFVANLYIDLIDNCSIDNNEVSVDNPLKHRGLNAIFELLGSIFFIITKDVEQNTFKSRVGGDTTGRISFVTLLSKISKHCPNIMLPFLNQLKVLLCQENGLIRRQIFLLFGDILIDVLQKNVPQLFSAMSTQDQETAVSSTNYLNNWLEFFILLAGDKDYVIRAHAMHYLIRFLQLQFFSLDQYSGMEKVIKTVSSRVCDINKRVRLHAIRAASVLVATNPFGTDLTEQGIAHVSQAVTTLMSSLNDHNQVQLYEKKKKGFSIFVGHLRNLLLPNLYKLLHIPPNSEEFSPVVLHAVTEFFCGKIPSLRRGRTKIVISTNSDETNEADENENDIESLATTKMNLIEENSTPRLFIVNLDCCQLLRPLVDDDNNVLFSAVSKIVHDFLDIRDIEPQTRVLNFAQFFGSCVEELESLLCRLVRSALKETNLKRYLEPVVVSSLNFLLQETSQNENFEVQKGILLFLRAIAPVYFNIICRRCRDIIRFLESQLALLGNGQLPSRRYEIITFLVAFVSDLCKSDQDIKQSLLRANVAELIELHFADFIATRSFRALISLIYLLKKPTKFVVRLLQIVESTVFQDNCCLRRMIDLLSAIEDVVIRHCSYLREHWERKIQTEGQSLQSMESKEDDVAVLVRKLSSTFEHHNAGSSTKMTLVESKQATEETLSRLVERELLEGFLSRYIPLCDIILQMSSVHSCSNFSSLKCRALMTLSSFMSHSPSLATKYLSVILNCLKEKNEAHSLHVIAMVVAARIIPIIPNSSQEITDLIFDELHSEARERKEIAFQLVSSLILRRLVKAEERIHKVSFLLVDDDERTQYRCIRFFRKYLHQEEKSMAKLCYRVFCSLRGDSKRCAIVSKLISVLSNRLTEEGELAALLLSGLLHDPTPYDRLYILSMLHPNEKSLRCLCTVLQVEDVEEHSKCNLPCKNLEFLTQTEVGAAKLLQRHLQHGKHHGNLSVRRCAERIMTLLKPCLGHESV